MSAVYNNDELEARLNGIIFSGDLQRDGADSGSFFVDLDSGQARTGDVLIAPGQRVDGVMVLLAGKVTVSSTGRRDVVVDAADGELPIFGVFEWLQGGVSQIQVIAAADCETEFINGDKFLVMLNERPDVCVRLAAAAGRAYTAAVKALRDGKESYNN